MKRLPGTLLWSAAILALLFAVPAPSFAQGKIKVAIWEFENHADGYWYSSKLGPAARDQIDTEFSQRISCCPRNSV